MNSLGVPLGTFQVFIAVFLTALLSLATKLIINRARRALLNTPNFWDESFFEALNAPLQVLIWIAGVAFSVSIIQTETGAPLFEAIGPLRDIGVIATLTWFALRFIRLSERQIIARKKARGESYDRTTFDAIAKLLRLSVLITAVLVALQNLGFSISGLLAFGGLGGIAVGFAAKDLLANFFGGLMIYLDRPFAVGDWIRSADREIEGVVEEIGWRQTLIRKFDTRPLYIPNNVFSSIAIENPSRMNNRLLNETIGIRYDDAAAMKNIVADVETMLRAHEEIDQDKFLMVNFNDFAPSSLDFFIYCYTRTTAWAHFHAVKQDVLLRIIEIIESHGAEIAFPTSTLHLVQEAKHAGEEGREIQKPLPPPRKS
ncbi:MAG: mechanosensitive ion channel family protein [Gammaproteobacteria bacterium AqS3]|nr:mechanosensitive ion channel family protein [Gammaproteobacteria bacterium AqS3]